MWVHLTCLHYNIKLHRLRVQTGLMIQTKKKATVSPATHLNQTNCWTVLMLNRSCCLSLISLIDNLFSPTELPLSIPNSERRSSWKSLEGSCFSETAALPHLAQTITQHSESLRSCSLPYCPLRFAEALVLPAWLLSGSQTVWKPISRFIKLTFTFKMKV